MTTTLELPNPPWIVGHRGASEAAPENSLESLRLAVAQGADMAEIDLRLTADGHLVAFHDAELDRLTGAPGRIEEITLADLAGHRVRGAPIPTLEQVFDTLPARYPLNLELKRTHAEPERLVEAVAEAVDDRSNLLVSSFQADLLVALAQLAPEVPLAPLTKTGAAGLLETARKIAAFSVHCHHRMATAELVSAAGSFGWPVLAYTVNDVETARQLVEIGVSGLFTDRPGCLRAELAVPA